MVSKADAMDAISSYRDEMVNVLSEMVRIPAISPKSGGKGEEARALFLEEKLRSWGFTTQRYEYTDDSGFKRPSIVSKLGSAERTIWFVGHIDTVAVGDISLWKTDPFNPVEKDGRLYGRGVSDDGQSVVGIMFAARVIKEHAIHTKYNFGIVLAADEEVGSRYGMQKLMDEQIFRQGDMFVVPDSGNSKGSIIEVGEKGLLWVKIVIEGVQAHASIPEIGKNAFRYMCAFLEEADALLHEKYSKTNPLFQPSYSTFEMTKHEKNVDSVNIIPGKETFYIDCRVLPEYKLDDILADLRSIASSSKFSEVKISIESFVREDPAPPTNPDSEIVAKLASAIKETRGISPKAVGIGGGTCAAFARKRGFDAAVWCTEYDVAHMPNEYVIIEDMVADAKVFVSLMMQ
jgi:succinyl-diaminopimelate desuccinylase